MTLSEDQIITIRQELELNGVTISTLKDDLLDHLCCDIERQMDEGKDFAEALSNAVTELAPRGLHGIQHETFLLLNPKMIPMKKLTYTIGLVSSMMMALGWLMSILHLPGSGNLATVGVGSIGFAMFILLFLPLFAFSKFKAGNQLLPYEKNRIRAGLLSGFITLAGVLFKVLHLPGASELIFIGVVLFIFAFLPLLFYGMYRKAVV